MQPISSEILLVNRASAIFWMVVVGAILITGQWWGPACPLREKMSQQWKPSLAIALLYLFSTVIGGMGFYFLTTIAKFCQAMIGLALAYSIAGFEPLPATQAVVRREQWTKRIAEMLGAAAAVVIVAIVVGSLSSALLLVLGETVRNPQGVSSFFPPNVWQGFFLLLAGAGIAEETVYRLVFVSLFWRLTRNRWAAIIISALLFGAYHLSPLDAFYRQFWERPITIFTTSAIMGMVMGYVYLKRGYESAVLGHTLADWIPLLLSRIA